MLIHFFDEFLLDEAGNKIEIKEEEIFEECLKQVDVSFRIIKIIEKALEERGYTLDLVGYKYRKSALFNRLERSIVASNEYQGSKAQRHVQREKTPPSIISYGRESSAKKLQMTRMRRPAIFSMKA